MKKKLMIVIPVLIVALIAFLGKSLAIFNYSKEGLGVNYVTINGIDITFANPNSTALTLINPSPTSDSNGLNGTPFVFTLTNTSSNAIDYVVKLQNDGNRNNTCYTDPGNTQNCSILSTNYIRYAYKIGTGSYSTPQTLGSNNDIVITNTINTTPVEISLLIWVDSGAPSSVEDTAFYGKLVLQGHKSTGN